MSKWLSSMVYRVIKGRGGRYRAAAEHSSRTEIARCFLLVKELQGQRIFRMRLGKGLYPFLVQLGVALMRFYKRTLFQCYE
jgi:hypothetical protein